MANKEYKSDVFSMLLQDKKRAMEIYNAINGTDYDDPELVEMTTLDDKSFSLTVRNDASFILDANLSLYEHQSTYCPNMPLRDLLYFASIIQKQIKAQKRDIYGGSNRRFQCPIFAGGYFIREEMRTVGNRFESGNCQQILHGLRRLSKTVNQFFEHFLRFLIRFNSGYLLIHSPVRSCYRLAFHFPKRIPYGT